MVHFEPADEVTPISAGRATERAAARFGSTDRTAGSNAADAAAGSLAPVTYLRGTGPIGDPGSTDTALSAGPGEDSQAEAEGAAEREHAEQILLQRLRARSLSATEARTVLAGTEMAEHEIDEVILRFGDLGYIDEGRLADQILYSHHERKGLGRSGVQAEMRRRGLDHDLILERLEALPDDEAERAIELACKRVRQLGRLDDQTIDRRLTGFLMRKGYASSAVRLAVKAALASRSGSAGSSGVRFR
jgi:regulatory protein